MEGALVVWEGCMEFPTSLEEEASGVEKKSSLTAGGERRGSGSERHRKDLFRHHAGSWGKGPKLPAPVFLCLSFHCSPPPR